MSLGADGVSTVSAQMQHSHVPITDVIVVLGGPAALVEIGDRPTVLQLAFCQA